MATNYDDILYPDKSPRAPQPEKEPSNFSFKTDVAEPVVAAVESGLRRASFGVLDNAAAGLESLVTRKPLQVILDRMRAQRAAQEQANPTATTIGGTVGEIAGTMVAPQKLLVQVPLQAAQAAGNTYFGSADATAQDAGKDATMQAVVTSLFGIGAKAVGGAMDAGKNFMFNRSASQMNKAESMATERAKQAVIDDKLMGINNPANVERFRLLKELSPTSGKDLEQMAKEGKGLFPVGTMTKAEMVDAGKDIANIWKRPFSDLSGGGALFGAGLSGATALYNGADPYQATLAAASGGVVGAKVKTVKRLGEAVGNVAATKIAQLPGFIPGMEGAVTRSAAGVPPMSRSFEEESNPYLDLLK